MQMSTNLFKHVNIKYQTKLKLVILKIIALKCVINRGSFMVISITYVPYPPVVLRDLKLYDELF